MTLDIPLLLRSRFAAAIFLVFAASATAAISDEQALPEALRAPGETVLLTVHAEGAQVYECAADATGKPAWRFREPIATLFDEGKTVGRHYAGPQWELVDGGGVLGKVESKVDGATPSDIPWLKLTAVSHRGQGILANATTIRRIQTHGGVLVGDCDAVGAFRAVPYSADYIFSAK